KFTPLFVAKLIEDDPEFYPECKPQVLSNWIASLVERGSMLKYQHRLTNALMNRDAGNSLLKNLPFSANRLSRRYEITLEEFSQRRLSLISCILSNMREHLCDSDTNSSHTQQSLGDQYRELIKTLMATMKSKYLELGKDASVQESY